MPNGCNTPAHRDGLPGPWLALILTPPRGE